MTIGISGNNFMDHDQYDLLMQLSKNELIYFSQ